MKPDNFNPIEIAFDYDGHAQWRQLYIEKLGVRNDILLLFRGHSKMFHNDQLPPTIDEVAILVNTPEMRELIAQFESIPIEMDFNSGESPTPTFEYYTTNQKQNDIVNCLDAIISEVTKSKKLGIDINVSNLIDAFHGAIYYDINEGIIDINHKFVLSCH